MIDPNHKLWNEQQQELRRALERPLDHQKAIGLFLNQHAMVHSAKMSQTRRWFYEDEILEGLTDEDIRRIPQKEEHSIAWVLWHLARIEDVTMNMLIASSPQIFYDENWLTKMEFMSSETGNALDKAGIALLSTVINIDALRAYRISVGRSNTRDRQTASTRRAKTKGRPCTPGKSVCGRCCSGVYALAD